jgi:hypothetical protein
MQEKGDVHQTDARKDKNSKHLAGARGGGGTIGEFVDDGAVIEERRGTAHVEDTCCSVDLTFSAT